MNEPSTNESGPKSQNRIVAFVDILGASQAALSSQSSDLVGRIFRLGRTMQWTHRINTRNSDGTLETQVFKPGVAQFSDCLLLWSDPLNHLEPQQFTRTAGSFLWNLCAEMGRLLIDDIPFRAGVSEGPVFIYPELNIFAGRPIVEAAKLESCQDWLGAAMLFEDQPDRLIRRIDQIYGSGDPSMFEHVGVPSQQVPLKLDTPGFLAGGTVVALNWALSVQETQGPSYLDLQRRLLNLREKASDKVKGKYEQALVFLDAVELLSPKTERGACVHDVDQY